MYSTFAQQYLKKAFTRVFCMLKVIGDFPFECFAWSMWLKMLSNRVFGTFKMVECPFTLLFWMLNVIENCFHSSV